MKSLSALLLSSSLFLLSPSAEARSLPDHPVLESILARYEGKTTGGTCSSLVDSAFKTIAARENMESALLLKDTPGGCRMSFVAAGGKDFVNRDPEQYAGLLSDADAKSGFDLHVHPLSNGEYFREGGDYRGEIMFASAAAIREAQLPADLYDALVAKVREGSVPGFNLSPPSLPDLHVATSENRIPLQYVVATSGGVWIYSLAPEADREEIWKKIDDIKTYSFMYAMAKAEGGKTPPEKKQRAQALFDLNMQDAETKKLVDEWQACSLALRKPYSKQAVTELLAGKDKKIQAEFAERVAFARRWSDLMQALGFNMEFRPF